MYRILIADDEKSIRDGVARYLAKHCADFEVAGLAENGEEALKLAQSLLPDVIITDITMPRMNGLDFLENISCLLPDARLIVLSGYDRFEYARQALRIGVREYLLKPLDTTKLLAILEKFKKELDQSRRALGPLAGVDLKDSHRNPRLEQLYGKLLNGGNSETEPMIQEPASYCCVLCSGDVKEEIIREGLYRKFARLGEPVLIRMEAGIYAAVFRLPGERASEEFLKLNLGLTSLANYMRSEGLGELHFFIGGFVTSVKGLPISMYQARQAMEYGFIEDMPPAVNYEDSQAGRMAVCLYPPEEIQKELALAVNYGNETMARARVCDLCSWFDENGIRDAAFIRMCFLTAGHRIQSPGRDAVRISYLEAERFRRDVLTARSFLRLKEVFLDFIIFLIGRKRGEITEKQVISEKVDRILRENMANPEFSLDDVAGLLFISPNYLRQLFKQETGMTFVEYLTRARLEHAKFLLSSTDLKVSEAAELVGYKDPRYFSSCFKKMFHISPSDISANSTLS
ncbi:response regulator [Lachnotalea sp. AF33-28]|uniref:response regulator n=1 Tax=Lachnotalea sp. AF33-28 TaxID=2292046 RepID=UPI001314286C|nr:response regulator [Lachnotalea sp. AF33-28]